jgi:hypothetical protein
MLVILNRQDAEVMRIDKNLTQRAQRGKGLFLNHKDWV